MEDFSLSAVFGEDAADVGTISLISMHRLKSLGKRKESTRKTVVPG